MADIASKVAQIRQAGYGKDVRESIASGIEAINTEVESTTAKENLLETTFNGLVINAGSSNAEIVAGRTSQVTGQTSDTLGHRIDGIDSQLAEKAKQSDLDTTNTNVAKKANQIDLNGTNTNLSALQTQVNSLASGAPKAVSLVSQMTDTTKNYVYTGSESGYTAGHWYYYNGSAWTDGGVYQSTGIGNNSVTSAMRTPIGTKAFTLCTKFDFNTTSKLLTYTGVWINYNNESKNVPDGSLDLSSLGNNAFIFYDTINQILVTGTSTNQTQENYILIAMIYIPSPIDSVVTMMNFTVNGIGLVYSTKRTPIGSYNFCIATMFDYNQSTGLLAWKGLWINYWNESKNVPDGSLDVSSYNNSSCFIVLFDTVTTTLKIIGNNIYVNETDIFIACIWVANPSQSIVTVNNFTYNNRPVSSKPLLGLKYACMGDSITSDQVSGVGTLINSKLGTISVGNYACGWATCQDWQNNGSNNTTITLTAPNNTNTNDNVLSNQVRRMLQHTTASGSRITWTHPIDGVFSIDTSIGTGLGYTLDIPDVIYIAISTNDGENANTLILDDTDTVFGQTYSQLTRISIASALRWAIETLQSAYPNANIFIASPLQTNCSNSWMSYTNNKLKRDIIDKVCQFCSVHFIDSFNESGYSMMKAKTGVLSVEGIHPNTEGKLYLTNFVSNEINRRFINR